MSSTPTRDADSSMSAEVSAKGVCVPHLRCPYDGLSTHCESLKLGCPSEKASWTEMTSDRREDNVFIIRGIGTRPEGNGGDGGARGTHSVLPTISYLYANGHLQNHFFSRLQ